MKNILLLGALVMFACTISAQSDAPACSEKEKTEKVCAKTGKKCSETCANKKTGTCCEGKKKGEAKACCSKGGDKKACAKEGEKSSCVKSGEKKAYSKSGDAAPTKGDKIKRDKTKGDKRTKTKIAGMSK